MILPALAGQQEIKTVAQPRSGAHASPDLSNLRPIMRLRRNAIAQEFIWKVVTPEERMNDSAVAGQGKPVDDNVNHTADISHLNKRRHNARVRNVTEAILKLKGALPFSKELEEVASIPK